MATLSNLSDITAMKDDWRIKVHVVRMWTVSSFNMPEEVYSFGDGVARLSSILVVMFAQIVV